MILNLYIRKRKGEDWMEKMAVHRPYLPFIVGFIDATIILLPLWLLQGGPQ